MAASSAGGPTDFISANFFVNRLTTASVAAERMVSVLDETQSSEREPRTPQGVYMFDHLVF
jgi:hypothetical protein